MKTERQDDTSKDDYVLRSLSKIKHKKWELFVISKIVHTLVERHQDIEFVCQQAIKTDRELHPRLVDFFLPQFGLYLEVDEQHHETKNNKDEDIKRTQDIVRVSNLKEKRIAVMNVETGRNKSLHTISEEVDELLAELSSKKQELIASGAFEPWDFENRFNPQKFIEKGFVSISDNPVFRLQKQALSCFGYTGGNYQRAKWVLPYDKSKFVWFPRLYNMGTWHNELSEDGTVIIERESKGENGMRPEIYKPDDSTRIVFARYLDVLGKHVYRYLGEFQINREKSTSRENVFDRVFDRTETRADELT
ncbi:MAG: AbaSI family restriction endonuclease [Pseudomonadota bacterium]